MIITEVWAVSVFRKRVNKKVHVGSLDADNSLFFILGSSYILLCYLFILNALECVLYYINLKKLKINKISTDGSDRHSSPEASRQVLLCLLGPSRTIFSSSTCCYISGKWLSNYSHYIPLSSILTKYCYLSQLSSW